MSSGATSTQSRRAADSVEEESPDSPAATVGREQSLAGLRVVDIATLFAGPIIATTLGDFGADVLKVEHPRGDAIRSLGWQRDGISLWWCVVGRNKRCVTLDLSKHRGQQMLRDLLRDADVLIENFRPGTLERWHLAPEDLQRLNPGLVVVRTTGFGQTGPYSHRAGYGTIAEAMSGFAHVNGWRDGPPTLPPFALGDGIAALTGTYAVMFALWWRDHAGRGRGQVIDLSIYEPLFALLGPQATVYDQLGEVQERTGNRTPFSAPRDVYRAADGQWLALSGTSQSIAERVARIVDRADLIAQPWFRDHVGRLAHRDELDRSISAWIAERSTTDVLKEFDAAGAAIAPIYSIEQIMNDEQYRARQTVTTVDHPQLGGVRMQNVVPRLSVTPGRIGWPAASLGQHNDEIYQTRLGLSVADLGELRSEGVI